MARNHQRIKFVGVTYLQLTEINGRPSKAPYDVLFVVSLSLCDYFCCVSGGTLIVACFKEPFMSNLVWFF